MSGYRYNRPNFNLNIGQLISNFFRNSNPLNRLIIINICIFIGLFFLKIFFNLTHFLQGTQGNGFEQLVFDWLGVHSDRWHLITRPWTFVTSIFLHVEFSHIFFNMITLWIGGQIFLYYFSPKQIYTVYILGGILGNIFFILSYNIFPVFSDVVQQAVAIGASGGVLAVLLASAAKAPNHTLPLILIGNVSLKWIAIFLVIIDIISISGGNSGGHFAHLGGALFGFLYVCVPKWNQGLKSRQQIRAKQSKSKGSRPKSDEQYNAERTTHRKKVDEILDKVAQSGYKNLSAEEKEFLFKTSQKKNW